ncbi:hypothetical protein [uncultured Erythrobacter sp.]|uniref:hypothetical protein n=1 Tax=uncultured Erythrobacter sp. TaxID=263913 RepID=UPI002637AB42|nr:hypothetical protein [uncultured Erythrobacter sp.]
MRTTRRSAIFGGLAAATGVSAAGQTLAGCAPSETLSGDQLTKVTVLGVIHRTHRTSSAYSLDVLREAVRRAEPNVILTEIPPDRIGEAKRGFAETGEVTEPRARVFPEYTDVVFPLSREMDFEMLGTAGWTQKIADDRGVALKAIENDPARASQWEEHEEARAEYSNKVRGRGDDPAFIHTPEYDVQVQQAQTPYQIYFDGDLGSGGWTKINRAHTDLINTALDSISGQGLNALVMFGAWHKYMIERSLAFRGDIELRDATALFD